MKHILLLALAAAQEKPADPVALAWNVKRTVACEATWTYSSTREEIKGKTKSTQLDRRTIEMNLVPDNDRPDEGGFKVIITKAEIVRRTDADELKVTYEEGGEPVEALSPVSKEAGRATWEAEASLRAAEIGKMLAATYSLSFGAEGLGCFVWIDEKRTMRDPILGTEHEVGPGWMAGSGAPSILDPCGFTLMLPAEPTKVGRRWELGYSLVGDTPVRMQVASIKGDAVTLKVNERGTDKEDLFGDGKTKRTTREEIDGSVVFSRDGYLVSASQTRTLTQKTDSKDAAWQGSVESETASELTLRRKQ